MSTERIGRVIHFCCDICGQALDTGETQFTDALEWKKVSGWGSRKDENGEWMDICDECKGGG